MAKAAFKKKRKLFTSKLELNVRKKLMKCCIWSTALYDAETWDILESRWEIPLKFWNVVLEKEGEDQLDWSCEKWTSITKSHGGKKLPTYNKRRKVNWIGHILQRNCRLGHSVEGKIEGMVRRGRWCKQLLNDLRKWEDTGNWNRKHYITHCGELALEEAMDLT